MAVGVAAACVVCTCVRPGGAQESAAAAAPSVPLAEALSGDALRAYESARVLLNNGDAAGAMTKLKLAYDLSREPRLLFDMAVCARDLRAYARMRLLLERYLREDEALTPESRADVEAALATLRELVGAVRLELSESGAAVSVDGEGVTDRQVDGAILLDLGHHRLDVSKPGFEPFRQDLEIAGGSDVTIAVRMARVPLPARLLVVADAAAAVRVDGKTVGLGRFDGSVPGGRHAVEVTAAGKKPYLTNVDLVAGDTRTLYVTLSSVPARALGVWPWVAGGVVVAAAGAVGAYFLLRPHDPGQGQGPSLGTYTVP